MLKKYQINKQEEIDNVHGTKGNGKCKSIRNSEEMANRIKECAHKKSITFVENMKSFYFLMNQIDDLESNGGQVIIKNEIASESLIPTVELNIKNEIIYPNDEGHQQVIMGSVIQQHQQEPAPPESKRKKRKNNKRKPTNGQTTMEIDQSGNLVARQIITTQDHHHQQQSHPSNLHVTQQHDNNEMALMLTVKHADQDHSQPHTITVSNSNHSIQPIQIHSSEDSFNFL